MLAVVVYPGQGFAGDLRSFQQWAQSFAVSGPEEFYAADPDANYPPLAILVLGAVRAVAQWWAGMHGGSVEHGFLVLIKVPAVLADVVTTGLVYLIGRDRYRPSVGLLAAGLYAVLPPVWYVSALWGQIDSVMIVFVALALYALCRRAHLIAAVAGVLAMLVKPQGVLVLLVVVVVVVAELAGRSAPGPDASGRRRIGRLVAIGLVSAVVLVAPLTWFGYRRLGPWTVPVVGDLAGFVDQAVATGALFPVLTANAYNGWALVGEPSLASSIGSGRALWWSDALPPAEGWPASGLVGLAALVAAVLLVLGGLLVRRDTTAVLFGWTVLSFAFAVLPTRSHERYLLPAFVAASVLAAAGLLRALGLVLAGLLNLVNLHAVLAAPLSFVTLAVGQTPPDPGGFGPEGGGGPPGGFDDGVFGTGGFGNGFGPDTTRPRDLVLPWAAQARAEPVVIAVSTAQLALALGLLVGWVVFVLRSRPGAAERPGRAQ